LTTPGDNEIEEHNSQISDR